MIPPDIYGVADLNRSKKRRVDEMQLSALNIATTLRYDLCVSAGTHVAGSAVTMVRPARNNYAAPFSVCDTCGVPVEATVVWRLRWTDFDKEDAA